jgi:hypothetical protein
LAVPVFQTKTVKSVFHKFLILVCALHLSGAHWVMLQVTAWTGMLITRVQEAPVRRAVATTFDGEHPCAMCLSISAAKKQEEKKPDAPAVPTPGDFKCVAVVPFTLPAAALVGEQTWPKMRGENGRWQEAPPTPPPLS